MNIKASYKTSVKDANGDYHTYEVGVDMEVSTEGLSKEQKVIKMRAATDFLHNELHKSIQRAQIADGIPPSLTHADASFKKG